MEKSKETTREWINKFIHANIQDEKYTEFWNFVVLWNLFEARLFDTHYDNDKAIYIGKTITLPQEIIDDTLEYFRKRYVENGKTNTRFDKLKAPKYYRDRIKSILLGEEKDDTLNLTGAIIIMICRYRNHFFHGVKDIANLSGQRDNFDIANKFLIACLETTREKK